MIAYLKGRITKKSERGAIIIAGSIGYFIHLTNQDLELSEEHEQEFFIYSHIRENSFDLYAFRNIQDIDFFKQLLSINGVGPKVALDILSAGTEKVQSAILCEDVDLIKSIPGIGPKTAKRILLELRGKIPDTFTNDRENQSLNKNVNQEVKDALNQLGYNPKQISDILKELPEEITKTEEIITFFLKNN
jgi:holliday junction DNA helicase RuvA